MVTLYIIVIGISMNHAYSQNTTESENVTGFEFDIINYPTKETNIKFLVRELERNQHYEFFEKDGKISVMGNNVDLSNSSIVDKDPAYLDDRINSIAQLITIDKSLPIGEPVQMCLVYYNNTELCEYTAVDKNHWATVRLDAGSD